MTATCGSRWAYVILYRTGACVLMVLQVVLLRGFPKQIVSLLTLNRRLVDLLIDGRIYRAVLMCRLPMRVVPCGYCVVLPDYRSGIPATRMRHAHVVVGDES